MAERTRHMPRMPTGWSRCRQTDARRCLIPDVPMRLDGHPGRAVGALALEPPSQHAMLDR